MLLEILTSSMTEGFMTIWAKRERNGKQESVTRWFDLSCGDAAERMYEDAHKLEAQGWDVYFSTCPVGKRGEDGYGKPRINAKDVISIPAFFMDVDTQLDPAKLGKRVPVDIEDAMRALGGLECPPSIAVGSGHGVHAYWILQDPIRISNDEDRQSAKTILRSFADAVKGVTEFPDLDTYTSEMARVLRVDGTTNFKHGKKMPVDVLPADGGPMYDVEELEAFALKYAPPEPVAAPISAASKRREPVDVVKTQANRREGVFSDEELVRRARSAANGRLFNALWMGDISGHGSHSDADIALCNMLAFWTKDDIDQMDRLFRQSGLMRDKWDRALKGSTYGAITIQNAVESPHEVYEPRAFAKKKADQIQTGKGAQVKKLADFQPNTNKRYGWSDIGNGNLFADWYKDEARYVPERQKWFVYDGKRWASDTDNLRTMELCKKLADKLIIFALGIEDEKQRQAYLDFVNTWQKRSRRETILKDAASVYPVNIDIFDSNIYAFNCLNGTLDLKSGEFREHAPADMLSKLANVNYDPKARSARWERFIGEVMQGDHEKAAFLQKALGYALTGDTRYECFFLLYGPTSRNGKGTSMETYMRMVGDYGRSTNPDTIAQKQAANGSGPSEDIARLAGARFVNISEPDQKLVLSTALVKTLTGNDTITARYLRENSFEYRPQFKLFINTNHLPKVTDVTLFSSGRVKLIPFERHFTEAEQDGGLKSELAQVENMSGILNWCIEGLRMIERDGFGMPESVRKATEGYRADSDKLGRFMMDALEEDVSAEVKLSVVYERYTRWCGANGFRSESVSNFKRMLENVAEVKRKRPNGSGRTGTAVDVLLGYRLTLEDLERMPTELYEREPYAYQEGPWPTNDSLSKNDGNILI